MPRDRLEEHKCGEIQEWLTERVRAMAYTCSIYGEDHNDLPHIGTAAPFHWADKIAADPNSRLTEDLCTTAGRDFLFPGSSNHTGHRLLAPEPI